MAVGTLLSRLTGFGRVLALIWAFGIVSGITDVYNVANTAPNIIYDLVLGGILSATLVPVFVEYLNHDDPDEGWRAISAVVTAITVTLLAVSAVFWLVTPAVIRFYLVLNKTSNVADQRAMGTVLLHLFVPQLFLLGGIAVTTALLNARRHFGAPAFSPVINNVVAIGAIVAARLAATSLTLPGFRHDQSALLILGLGTTAGYLFQFLVQLPPLWRAGFRLRPVWDFTHPAVRTVLRLSLWTFGSVIANQISFNFILVLAEPRKGDVTVFTTAYQFFQLPYAIFAVSIATVITPDLSEHWAKRDLPGFRRQMAAGLRLTTAVLVPAAVGYSVLAQPFLHLVLRHGSLSAGDAHRIATVVVLFAAGLPGFSVYLLLMRAYQAMQDTRSMFWLYLFENVATIALAAALYPVLGVKGLALGWVGAYTIGSVAAFAHLRRRTEGLDGGAIVAGLVRVAAATALMIVPVLALLRLLKGQTDLVLLAQVGGGVIVGAVVYLAAARLFGVRELATLLQRRHAR
jgi:putative peptidoglycan lipid II flippase